MRLCWFIYSAISAQCCISYRNQSFDLHCKSNYWFLYEIQHWAEMSLSELTNRLFKIYFNNLSAHHTKWSNTLKQFIGKNLNNSLAKANEFFECVWPFCGVGTWRVKGALSVLRQFLATESPLKMTKNALYFTLRALFGLKIFKFLSWIFVHVEKRLD